MPVIPIITSVVLITFKALFIYNKFWPTPATMFSDPYSNTATYHPPNTADCWYRTTDMSSPKTVEEYATPATFRILKLKKKCNPSFSWSILTHLSCDCRFCHPKCTFLAVSRNGVLISEAWVSESTATISGWFHNSGVCPSAPHFWGKLLAGLWLLSVSPRPLCKRLQNMYNTSVY